MQFFTLLYIIIIMIKNNKNLQNGSNVYITYELRHNELCMPYNFNCIN